MSDYKRYFLKQIGVSESLKPAGIQPSEVDPSELEMGMDDEKDHTNDPGEQQTIALQHLKDKPDYYSRIKAAGLEEEGATPPAFPKIMSPTAMVTPVIAMAVRGSSTGGLPSGADRNMSLPNIDGIDTSRLKPSQLGGYEPIPTARDNSELIDKTPVNQEINSNSVKNYDPQTQIDPHPHQVQKAQGEPPQDVTGASTEDSPLKLKMAMPSGVDVDLQEGDKDIQEDGSKEENVNKPLGMNETFARHLKLMNETIEARNLDECNCGPSCDCGGEEKKEETPEKVEEKYSPPFAKMRGLANLGERRVAKNGLWETTLKPGESTPQKWHMDKKRAGMVPDTMLKSIKERLSKKASLNETENEVLKKIDEVLQKRTAK